LTVRLFALFTAVALGVFVAVACSDGSSAPEPRVTVEPLTATPQASGTPRSGIAVGGKGAMLTPTATAEAPATPEPLAEPTAAPTQASARPEPDTPVPAAAPTSGRWIEVDVTNYIVRLMDGESVVREIAPVGVGVAIDTGAYISTQTGLFEVHNKVEALVYDAPFDTYISHWVGFDTAKDNGFHSFLKDEHGNVVDASTGRVSNGCIRTGEPDAVFAYAEIGMPVWVHW
jgi:hypothetical protein